MMYNFAFDFLYIEYFESNAIETALRTLIVVKMGINLHDGAETIKHRHHQSTNKKLGHFSM